MSGLEPNYYLIHFSLSGLKNHNILPNVCAIIITFDCVITFLSYVQTVLRYDLKALGI